MRIPIVFATDENYIFYTVVAISSLAKSAAEETRYEIYILVGEGFPENTLLNEADRRYANVEIHIVRVNAALFQNVIINNGHVTKATFYRLALCDLIDVEKCIYLDSDIIVTDDLKELFQTDLTGYYIAGCRDIWIDTLSDKARENRRKRTGIPSMQEYVNAGVIVMNLQKMKEDGLERKFMQCLKTDYPFEDQDILNVCCYGKICHLSARWNMFTFFRGKLKEMRNMGISEKNLCEFKEGRGIIHYATPFIRPWEHLHCWMNQEWWETAAEWEEKSDYQKLLKKVQEIESKEHWCCYLKKCKNYEKIILFGFTAYGKRLCDWLLNAGLQEKLIFCDNNPKKYQMQYRGVYVFPLREIDWARALFINASQRRSAEVTQLLFDAGVKQNDILCYIERQPDFYQYLDSRCYLDELKDIFLRERGESLEGFCDDLQQMKKILSIEPSYKSWREYYYMDEWILKGE